MIRIYTLVVLILLAGLAACESPMDVNTPRIKTLLEEADIHSDTMKSNLVNATITYEGMRFFPKEMFVGPNDFVLVDTSVFPPIVTMNIEPQFTPNQSQQSYPTSLWIKIDSIPMQWATPAGRVLITDPRTTPNGARMDIVTYSNGMVVTPRLYTGADTSQYGVSFYVVQVSFGPVRGGIPYILGEFRTTIINDDIQQSNSVVEMDFTITW